MALRGALPGVFASEFAQMTDSPELDEGSSRGTDGCHGGRVVSSADSAYWTRRRCSWAYGRLGGPAADKS